MQTHTPHIFVEDNKIMAFLQRLQIAHKIVHKETV